MKFYQGLAAGTVFVSSIAAQGWNPPPSAPAQKSDDSTRIVCEVTHPVGSRLGGVRRCRTQAEWAAYRLEVRDTVDRIQSGGATQCPNPATC